MKKKNKYPLRKIIFCLVNLIFSGVLCTGCSNEAVRFLEAEMENEEIVQLTPSAVQEGAGSIQEISENAAKVSGEFVGISEKTVELSEKDVSETKTSEEMALEVEPLDEQKVFVYVCGAVVNPGVYEMDAAGRVFQAVELAGGFRENAVPEYVNQAMPVTDGQQIYIPEQAEIQDGIWVTKEAGFTDGRNVESGAENTTGKVNINTADKTELMTISGIGESRAQDIIAYREEHGGFSTIDEIMNVPGIKEATFEKIKDGIEVK